MWRSSFPIKCLQSEIKLACECQHIRYHTQSNYCISKSKTAVVSWKGFCLHVTQPTPKFNVNKWYVKVLSGEEFREIFTLIEYRLFLGTNLRRGIMKSNRVKKQLGPVRSLVNNVPINVETIYGAFYENKKKWWKIFVCILINTDTFAICIFVG